jgi:hypothetical protein
MDIGMNYGRKEGSDKVLEARRNGRKSLIVKTCKTPSYYRQLFVLRL